MDREEQWNMLNLSNTADREAVALALFRAGYAVRTRKQKEGNKTIVILEYRKGVTQC
jgi:hypothetical protein